MGYIRSSFYWTIILSITKKRRSSTIYRRGLMPNEQFFSYCMAVKICNLWNDDDDICIILIWICIVLTQYNKSWRFDMKLHSDTLSWFWAKHSLFLLLNARAYPRSIKYQFYSIWFDPTEIHVLDTVLESRALSITQPMLFRLFVSTYTFLCNRIVNGL